MGNINTFQKEFGLLIVGAIIFTASFLWKDLFAEIQDQLFPKQYSNLLSRCLFTIIITVILVCIAVNLKPLFGLSKPIQFDDSPINNNNDNKEYISIIDELELSSLPNIDNQ